MTTGKVGDVRRVVSNDAPWIQVSALNWILPRKQGESDGRLGRIPCFSHDSVQQKKKKRFQTVMFQNSKNTSKTPFKTMHGWTHLSAFNSTPSFPSRAVERGREKEQRSVASGTTEWHFYDVSQIIPRDGWAGLKHQLINPSTGGMCCGCLPAQLFFPPRTEHWARHAGEDD